MFVVFGLVKFEQDLHVFKSNIHMTNKLGFHVVEPFIGVDQRRDGADCRNGREDDSNSDGKNLRVSQLFSSTG